MVFINNRSALHGGREDK
ncbi:hypothetical protein GF413_03260 [Candidatus Micrarchaeota archaeon]|nr:hypothetical protein [Candidatus Micrarchaeota archaeon]